MALSWLATMPAVAQPTLHKLNVKVTLRPDYILVTQVRDVSAGDHNEDRIDISDRYLMKKNIMNVSVYGEDGYFQRLEYWNMLASTAEKQRKCGRMWVGAHEALLCWGMTPQKRKTYFITYPLQNVLYSDGKYDVLDYDFFRLSKPFLAEQAEISVSLDSVAFSEGDVIMSQSHADGDIGLKDGTIVIKSRPDDTPVKKMHVHLAFREGLFGALPMKSQMKETSNTNISDKSGGGIKNDITGESFQFSGKELNSTMMNEDKPKSESPRWGIFELISEYPKTSIIAGCLLLMAGAFIYRKIKAMML